MNYEIPSHWQKRQTQRPEWERTDGVTILAIENPSEMASEEDKLYQARAAGGWNSIGETCESLEEAIEMVDEDWPLDDS